MTADTLHSPLLHRTIYVEEAIHDALQWCAETYGITWDVSSEPQGWRIALRQKSTSQEEGGTSLKKVLNEILVRSLETRLEDMVP